MRRYSFSILFTLAALVFQLGVITVPFALLLGFFIDDLVDRIKKSRHNDFDLGEKTLYEQEAPYPEPVEEDYVLLGLHFGAGMDDVKTAYRKLIKEFHPDHAEGLNDEQKIITEEAFKRITDSYKKILAKLSKRV